MALQKGQFVSSSYNIRDIRPFYVRFGEFLVDPVVAPAMLGMLGFTIYLVPWLAELMLLTCVAYVFILHKMGFKLPLKLPMYANTKDPNNKKSGGGLGKAEGILYIGNERRSGQELWLNNSDARTHTLYLGTTGAGKTEGLKSLVTNALCWGSGFIYIDGKSDTDLWASLYSLARRFGREDDLLLLNYMTGNSDDGSDSNSINPFATGSASFLSNLMASLMDESGADNAMWKGRAISLVNSLMPALTYKRDKHGMILNVNTLRDNLELRNIIALSRDQSLTEKIRSGLSGYLLSLPGYADEAFGDDGLPAPPSPEQPPMDTSVPMQQHGYLQMQFTRQLQSLGDEYSYIFAKELADVDMLDVVLNRRILLVLIPALEKSGDEAANLGKIVASSLKGMMGSTLGADVEGEWDATIENKPTKSSSPFLTVFDEVGYYITSGMAVMAAQARSLGFGLIFAAQDLPALESRVDKEAKSITANCNLKLFGKLEDPMDTKQFFDATVGQNFIGESTGMKTHTSSASGTYMDKEDTSFGKRGKADYDELKFQTEGQVHLCWRHEVFEADLFYANPKRVDAMRIQRMIGIYTDKIPLPKVDSTVDKLIERLSDENWTARDAGDDVGDDQDIAAIDYGLKLGSEGRFDPHRCGILAIASIADLLAREQDTQDSGYPEDEEDLRAPFGGAMNDIFGAAAAEEGAAPSSSDELRAFLDDAPSFNSGLQSGTPPQAEAAPQQPQSGGMNVPEGFNPIDPELREMLAEMGFDQPPANIPPTGATASDAPQMFRPEIQPPPGKDQAHPEMPPQSSSDIQAPLSPKREANGNQRSFDDEADIQPVEDLSVPISEQADLQAYEDSATDGSSEAEADTSAEDAHAAGLVADPLEDDLDFLANLELPKAEGLHADPTTAPVDMAEVQSLARSEIKIPQQRWSAALEDDFKRPMQSPVQSLDLSGQSAAVGGGDNLEDDIHPATPRRDPRSSSRIQVEVPAGQPLGRVADAFARGDTLVSPRKVEGGIARQDVVNLPPHIESVSAKTAKHITRGLFAEGYAAAEQGPEQESDIEAAE